MKPTIWKLKSGQTRDTKIERKGLTHNEVWQKSLDIVKKIEQSPFIQKVIIFTECDLSKMWFLPISNLEKKLNLTIKPEINKNMPLKQFMVKTAIKTFPLLTNYEGFKETQLLDLVKKQQINALLTISGHCQPNILGNFKIFTTKEKKKINYTNEIKDKIVSVPFLSLLLNEKKLNFHLTCVTKVYLFPTSDLNPFSEKSKDLLKMINDNRDHKLIVSFLKSISNFFIGSLSFSPNSYKQHHVLSKTDFFNLDWARFQGSFSINEDISICTFNNNSNFSNNIHNHFNIISLARGFFLEFAIGIAKWTKGELKLCNTGKRISNSYLYTI